MLTEAKYLEITLVMHFKSYIGRKRGNFERFCLPELLYRELNYFVGYAYGGKIP